MAHPRAPGPYKISDAPVTSSETNVEPEPTGASDLPSAYSRPLLLAMARNPRTLFICWSVDWPAVFAQDLPADRQAHIKIKGGASEETHAVEPLRGNYCISGLKPGETYALEMGYYGTGGRWASVASSNEVMLPFERSDTPGQIDLASVPFHLSFQLLVEIFGGEKSVMRKLAEFQQRVADSALPPNEVDQQLLDQLGFSVDDLRAIAALREAMAKSPPALASEPFSGSSWTASFFER